MKTFQAIQSVIKPTSFMFAAMSIFVIIPDLTELSYLVITSSEELLNETENLIKSLAVQKRYQRDVSL